MMIKYLSCMMIKREDYVVLPISKRMLGIQMQPV